MKGQITTYYLTEKGASLDLKQNFFLFFPEETFILELLKESPQNINSVLVKLNNTKKDSYGRIFKKKRSYEFVQTKLRGLEERNIIKSKLLCKKQLNPIEEKELNTSHNSTFM